MTTYTNQWNYATDSQLDTLISLADFKVITGNTLSSTDAQITATLKAVSNAVRSFCGWHVSPSLTCYWQGDADGRLVQLPAMNVTSIHSVTINGSALASTEYSWRPSGLIRLKKPVDDDWGQLVSVEFESGVSADILGATVSQIAVNTLVAPAGVQREQVGDVSIAYNLTASGVTGGIRLLPSDKAMLKAFQLPPVR